MFTPGASSAFQAAEDVTDSASRHAARGGSPQSSPTDRSFLTFVLSHVFVLPGAAEQHQPHSPADTELRVDSRAEPASQPPLGRRNTGVSTHRRSPLLLRFPLAVPPTNTQPSPARSCGASFKRGADQWGRPWRGRARCGSANRQPPPLN